MKAHYCRAGPAGPGDHSVTTELSETALGQAGSARSACFTGKLTGSYSESESVDSESVQLH